MVCVSVGYGQAEAPPAKRQGTPTWPTVRSSSDGAGGTRTYPCLSLAEIYVHLLLSSMAMDITFLYPFCWDCICMAWAGGGVGGEGREGPCLTEGTVGFGDWLQSPQEGHRILTSVSKDQMSSKVKSGGLCPCQWAVSRRMGLAETACRHAMLCCGRGRIWAHPAPLQCQDLWKQLSSSKGQPSVGC